MDLEGVETAAAPLPRSAPSKDDEFLAGNDTTSPLCGRQEQQVQLLEAYRRRTSPTTACQQQEMVLITGASGTGKTALAQTLARQVEADRGYFCAGKCDQMEHCNEPFAPFVAAITQLIETVLQRDDTGEEIIRLEEAMAQATRDTELGMSLLCGLFRVFKKVLLQDQSESGRGSSRPFSISGSAYSNTNTNGSQGSERSSNSGLAALIGSNVNRPGTNQTGETPAVLLFCKFLREFSSVQHPIVLLLDDWQWLDPSSLELLKVLGSKENNFPGLMILGTCRGNEVSIQDPLSVVLRALEEQDIVITDIQLAGLSLEGVHNMVTNLLPNTAAKDEESIRPLAELIHQMTQGNPFFVQQSIKVIYQSKLLDLNPSDGSWHWDKKALTSDAFFHGVDEENWEGATLKLLDAEIRKLADQSLAIRETLVVASFLGARFFLRHLVVLTKLGKEDMGRALEILEEQGIFVPTDNASKGIVPSSSGYRWAHDRFQQSANFIIPLQEQPAYSVNMGRTLLEQMKTSEMEEDAFLVANLLLRDLSLIQGDAERVRVATCLHLAGQKAAESSAFQSAGIFISEGINVLPEDPWGKHYDLCLLLHNEAMEMAFCNGHFESIDRLFETVLENSNNLQDEMRACETKLSSLSARHLDKDANALGFSVLKRLGVRFPRKATKLRQVAAVVKILFWLKRSSTEDILKIQPIQQWEKLAALRILLIIVASVIRSDSDYAAIWAARGVEIAINYGFSGSVPVMFTAMGMVLANPTVCLPEDAKRFVDLGQMIDQRYHAPEMTCRILGFDFAYVQPWHTTFHECKDQLLRATRAGLMSGDVELAYICASYVCWYGFTVGTPLNEHVEAMEQLYREFSRLNQQMAYMGCPLELGKRLAGSSAHLPQNALPDAPSFISYCDRLTDEDEKQWGRSDIALLCISYMCQLFMAAHLGDHEEGLRVYYHLCRLPYDETYSLALTIQIQFHFGLLEILAAQATGRKKWRAGLRALWRLRRFAWLMSCEENALNKIYLLQAERAVLKGDQQGAEKKFLAAIQYAEESSFLHEGALAHERFATALSKWGDEEAATMQQKKAAALYEEWGFRAKATEQRGTTS